MSKLASEEKESLKEGEIRSQSLGRVTFLSCQSIPAVYLFFCKAGKRAGKKYFVRNWNFFTSIMREGDVFKAGVVAFENVFLYSRRFYEYVYLAARL